MADSDTMQPVPDLETGVPSEALLDGVPLVGRFGSDTVLLTRLDGRCHAVAAMCTHHGAPLAEGLVVGHTVRCPWHHAAFDLRSGAVDRPPALDALPCWTVEECDGRVRVTGSRPPLAETSGPGRARHPRLPASVVIVGGGAAGVTVAETLRNEGYDGSVTILDDDPDAVVDRPNLSKGYLAGSAPEEWVALRSPAQLAERGITLRRARVGALEIGRRSVQLVDGDSLDYEALVLATGATPVRLPVPTADERPLLTLRSLVDAKAIVREAEQAPNRRAVVIGASFIGLEVAASLVARGITVHVVGPEKRPLDRVLGAEVGDWIRALHESYGVVFHLSHTPAATRPDGVLLDDGSLLPADFVVAGVGVRPNVALAEAAGIAVDRGVMVDRLLTTSARDVYAVGDIARWPDTRSGKRIRVEHWVVAQRQAATAARNVLGAGEVFDAVPFFWSAHHDVVVSYVGHAEHWDHVDIDGSLAARDAEVRYLAEGRLLAVASVGRDRAHLEAERELEGQGVTGGMLPVPQGLAARS